MSFGDEPLDPISATSRLIWEAFESCGLFNDVRLGNRVTFDTPQKVKAVVQDADLPEVVLTMPSATPEGLDSAHDTLVCIFRFTLSTGDMQFYNKLPFLVWRIFRLIGHLERTTVDQTLITGAILHSIGVMDSTIGYTMDTENRTKIGHAANVDIRTEIHFERSLYVLG
jgi:hypothetical protein